MDMNPILAEETNSLPAPPHELTSFILNRLGIPHSYQLAPLHPRVKGPQEYIHTVLLPSNEASEKYFLICHGFGGSSLMMFPLLKLLLEHGNVVLFELRGMGFSDKRDRYEARDDELEGFFLETFSAVLSHYSATDITMICHSFSAYFALLFITQNWEGSDRIKSMILLSPIGITPPELDRNNSIHSLSDIWKKIVHKFGWTFNLTYKSPLRTLCCCCRGALIRRQIRKENTLNEQEREMMKMVIEQLVRLSDGSESFFFRMFLPRVVAKVTVKMQNNPQMIIHMVYGGEQDWADRNGALELAHRFENVKVHELRGCGHMLPFYATEMRVFLNQTLKG